MPKLDKTEQEAFNVLLEGVEHWVMALVRAALAPDPSQSCPSTKRVAE